MGAHGSAADAQAAQAGRDATVARAGDQHPEKGRLTRLRERGMIVAFATIIGAIAVVIGTIVTVCAWMGWTP